MAQRHNQCAHDHGFLGADAVNDDARRNLRQSVDANLHGGEQRELGGVDMEAIESLDASDTHGGAADDGNDVGNQRRQPDGNRAASDVLARVLCHRGGGLIC